MMSLLKTAFYAPLLNLLVFLYGAIPGHSLGLAIIGLTLLVRLAFLPLSIKGQRSQRAINALNPKIKELKERHKNDQTAQNTAIMELYRQHGVNPIGGCLPILVQLPILIALYQVFIAGVHDIDTSLLYRFIANPGPLEPTFLGLAIGGHNRLLVIFSGLLQFIQSRQSSRYMQQGLAAPEMAAFNKQMLYLFPALIVVIGWNLPAGLVLYWITTTAFSIAEQAYLRKTP